MTSQNNIETFYSYAHNQRIILTIKSRTIIIIQSGNLGSNTPTNKTTRAICYTKCFIWSNITHRVNMLLNI